MVLHEELARRDGRDDLRCAADADAAARSRQSQALFLSHLRHELRTPLNAILGFAQVLEGEDLSAQQQEWLGHILLAGNRMLCLVEELLGTNPQAEHGPIRTGEHADLRAVARECQTALAEQRPERAGVVTVPAARHKQGA